MAEGAEQMQRWISQLQALGRDGIAEVAREAEPLVQEAARATAAAGTDPSGKAWPAKKDGGAPLVGSPSHITAKAAGGTIRIYLKGPDVFHHYGTKRVPKRQVIPEGTTVPAGIAAALHKAAAKVFARRMGAA